MLNRKKLIPFLWLKYKEIESIRINKNQTISNKMITWEYVRTFLSEPDSEGDIWATDILYLALNHGYCYLDGKHPCTSSEHWDLFICAIKNHEGYGEEICRNLFNQMNNDQKEVLQMLLEEDCISEDSE